MEIKSVDGKAGKPIENGCIRIILKEINTQRYTVHEFPIDQLTKWDVQEIVAQAAELSICRIVIVIRRNDALLESTYLLRVNVPLVIAIRVAVSKAVGVAAIDGLAEIHADLASILSRLY